MKPIEKTLVPGLQNGLTVLELLATSESSVGFNAISAHLGVSKATTSRLLKVLRHRNYVVKDEASGEYRPGPKMSFLNKSLPMIETLRKECKPVLESLREATENSTILIFWNGEELQCLAKKTHHGSVPLQDVGTLHRDLCSVPWGVIAYESLQKPERRKSEKLFGNRKLFKEHFPGWEEQLHKNGFIYDKNVLYKPLRRIAAPVSDSSGKLVGILSVAGNSLTMKNGQVKKFGKILLEHVRDLEFRI